MNANDSMSPDASPRRVPPQAGVRRVNDLPAYIVVTLMGIFVVMMALVAMDRSTKQNQGAIARDEKADNASRYASEIVGARKDGIIQPEKPAPPALLVPPPQAEPILVARPDNLDLPPAPPRGPVSQAAQRAEEERNRIRMAKLQMLEEGVKARTGVSIAAPRSAGSSGQPAGAPASRQDALAQLAAVRQQIDAQSRDNASAAYQARLQQLQAPGSANGLPEDSRTAPTLVQRAGSTPGGGKDVSQFAGAAQEDRWKLDAQPEAPRSPYESRGLRRARHADIRDQFRSAGPDHGAGQPGRVRHGNGEVETDPTGRPARRPLFERRGVWTGARAGGVAADCFPGRQGHGHWCDARGRQRRLCRLP